MADRVSLRSSDNYWFARGNPWLEQAQGRFLATRQVSSAACSHGARCHFSDLTTQEILHGS